ncbi:hypothetical protein [Parendozoicomonas haliclonae]|uniref:Uncharacterized protein n=1 Tax=Parendozoicomonas haliclonae TaxID=1960125 RepID=A0A1X7ADT9_9GAMM|nr:hypothetical protein [Parendozoicomonas haliclonae]SMA32708.1 hypothetical protein EHSB41UT_00182 [Parendozoicomonas haliclonae]
MATRMDTKPPSSGALPQLPENWDEWYREKSAVMGHRTVNTVVAPMSLLDTFRMSVQATVLGGVACGAVWATCSALEYANVTIQPGRKTYAAVFTLVAAGWMWLESTADHNLKLHDAARKEVESLLDKYDDQGAAKKLQDLGKLRAYFKKEGLGPDDMKLAQKIGLPSAIQEELQQGYQALHGKMQEMKPAAETLGKYGYQSQQHIEQLDKQLQKISKEDYCKRNPRRRAPQDRAVIYDAWSQLRSVAKDFENQKATLLTRWNEVLDGMEAEIRNEKAKLEREHTLLTKKPDEAKDQ